LKQTYRKARKTNKVRLRSLRRQFKLLSMTYQETIAKYFNKIQVLINSMSACDKEVKGIKIVEKVLRRLTPKFDHIIVAIEESKYLDVMYNGCAGTLIGGTLVEGC